MYVCSVVQPFPLLCDVLYVRTYVSVAVFSRFGSPMQYPIEPDGKIVFSIKFMPKSTGMLCGVSNQQ